MFKKAAKLTELKEGKGILVELGGLKIGIFRVGDRIFAIDDKCPHRNGSLSDGTCDNAIVSCPLHGWGFDLKTGKSTTMPNVKVTSYTVKTEGEIILVDI